MRVPITNPQHSSSRSRNLNNTCTAQTDCCYRASACQVIHSAIATSNFVRLSVCLSVTHPRDRRNELQLTYNMRPSSSYR